MGLSVCCLDVNMWETGLLIDCLILLLICTSILTIEGLG